MVFIIVPLMLMQYLQIGLYILGGLLALACVLSLFFGFFLTSAVIRPPIRSHKTALEYHINYNGVSPGYFESLNKHKWEFMSTTGHLLQGFWIEPEQPQNGRYIIMVHGHGHNMMGNLKYLPLFLSRGFRVLIYDQIHSGISEGKYTTMGLIEAKDLSKIIDSLYQSDHKPELMGLLGESMGAATVIMNICNDQRAHFAIADCSYADLEEQLTYRLKYAYKLGRFPLIPIGSLISKIRAGFFWKQVSPIQELHNKQGLPDIPILFAHGLSDTYIPPAASEKLFDAKTGYRELLLVENAKHTESKYKDSPAYDQAVSRLLAAAEDKLIR